MSKHGKGGTTKAFMETRTCFKCGKSGHIAKHCRSSQAKDKESAHQPSKEEEEDEFAFATHGGGEKANMFTWIVEVQVKICIEEVLHVPKLHANLLSVSKLSLGGLKVHFNLVGCIVRSPSGVLIASAPREGNLYYLHFTKVNGTSMACVAQGSAHEDLWSFGIGGLGT